MIKCGFCNRASSKENLPEVWEIFTENKIEPILIKGWAAARFYPNIYQRIYGDIDLAVKPSDFEKALEICRQYPQFGLDIHRGLRHLDLLDWDDLFENSELVECGEGFVRVLRAEDHLRVLCVHWLTDGGAEREKLWDIYFCFNSNAGKFDWDRCLNSVGKRRRRWFEITIALTEKYLPAVSLVGTPFEVKKTSISTWFLRALEKEWASEIRLEPLQNHFGNLRGLLRQIKKKTSPNPIQSTVEAEGDFDCRTPIFYQIRRIFAGILPQWQRLKAYRWGKKQTRKKKRSG